MVYFVAFCYLQLLWIGWICLFAGLGCLIVFNPLLFDLLLSYACMLLSLILGVWICVLVALGCLFTI